MSSSSLTLAENILLELKELEILKNHNKFWNISWHLGEFLCEKIKKKNPKNILEIGTSNGFSTLWIALGMSVGSKLTTIEVDDYRYNLAKKTFEKLSLNNQITQIKGEIIEILDFEQCKLNEKFDFIFLDAAQKKYEEVIEKLLGQKLLDLNCTIICDNVISHSYMDKFIIYMKNKFDDVEIYKKDSGFLIASFNSKK